jgi:hypothetical protein
LHHQLTQLLQALPQLLQVLTQLLVQLHQLLQVWPTLPQLLHQKQRLHHQLLQKLTKLLQLLRQKLPQLPIKWLKRLLIWQMVQGIQLLAKLQLPQVPLIVQQVLRHHMPQKLTQLLQMLLIQLPQLRIQ